MRGDWMKNKIKGFIYGMGCGKSVYEINNVKYIVESKFEPLENKTSIKDRFGKCVTDLNNNSTMDIIKPICVLDCREGGLNAVE